MKRQQTTSDNLALEANCRHYADKRSVQNRSNGVYNLARYHCVGWRPARTLREYEDMYLIFSRESLMNSMPQRDWFGAARYGGPWHDGRSHLDDQHRCHCQLQSGCAIAWVVAGLAGACPSSSLCTGFMNHRGTGFLGTGMRRNDISWTVSVQGVRTGRVWALDILA